MKKNIRYFAIALLTITPAVSFAALSGLRGLLCSARDLINLTIPVVIGLGLLAFLWGLAQFVLHAGDPKQHEDGKNKMIWGIVALFVMFSVMGIIRWVGDAVGITPGQTIQSITGTANTSCSN